MTNATSKVRKERSFDFGSSNQASTRSKRASSRSTPRPQYRPPDAQPIIKVKVRVNSAVPIITTQTALLSRRRKLELDAKVANKWAIHQRFSGACWLLGKEFWREKALAQSLGRSNTRQGWWIWKVGGVRNKNDYTRKFIFWIRKLFKQELWSLK